MRFLLKNKLFSLINIIGLAMGTLCCLYILLYVEQQYSYDRHEDHAADIYRVTTILKLSGDRHSDTTVVFVEMCAAPTNDGNYLVLSNTVAALVRVIAKEK